MTKQLIAQTIRNPVISGNNAQVTDPQGYFNNVIQTVFTIFFIVGIIYFVWHIVFAGYHFISSDGDPKKVEMAKNQVTFAMLGIFVVFSVYGILKLVGYVLGIDGLESLSIPWPSLL